MKIIGAEHLTEEEVALKLTEGFRLLSYEYCLSFLVITLKRPTSVYLVAPGDNDAGNRFLYSSLSFFIGWWGIPWGPIYTISTIYRNLTGGHDHSHALINHVLAKGPGGPPALPAYSPVQSGKTPATAITALVLGVVSIALFGPFTAIPAIICGHLALNQIRKTHASGRGLAIAGLILGYAVVAFYVFFIVYLLQGVASESHN